MLPDRELASPKAMTEGCFKAIIGLSVYGVHPNRSRHLLVTKPQAVIRPLTEIIMKNLLITITSYKTASGNQAFHPVARTRLTERA